MLFIDADTAWSRRQASTYSSSAGSSSPNGGQTPVTDSSADALLLSNVGAVAGAQQASSDGKQGGPRHSTPPVGLQEGLPTAVSASASHSGLETQQPRHQSQAPVGGAAATSRSQVGDQGSKPEEQQAATRVERRKQPLNEPSRNKSDRRAPLSPQKPATKSRQTAEMKRQQTSFNPLG